jgi:D-alanine-D-alanine ligase
MLRVGLTYDLRQDYLAMGFGPEETAEFDSIDTIDGLDETLTGLGFEVDRIGHVKKLAERLVAGDRWDFVFNICEGVAGLGREAQVPCLLDAWRIPYVFSDPLTLSLTLDKAMAKKVLMHDGVPTVPFVVLNNAREAASCALPYPVFAKPVAEGSGKGVGPASKCHNAAELKATTAALIRQFDQPVLVETFLPGREFTVGIVGDGPTARAIGVMEVVIEPDAAIDGYGYTNKQNWEGRVGYELVDDEEAREASCVAVAGWRSLRCRDGGRVDIRSDANGKPHFIEVNPLAGLHPTYSDLVFLANFAGLRYRDLIGLIVEAFLARTPGLKGQQRVRRPRIVARQKAA